MKARRKWNRLFAMLLVATLIFNSQATALLAMDGESFGVAGDKTELFSGTGGSAEIIDEGDTQIIPDGEVEASSFGSGTQAGNGQDNSFLLGQEVVPGTAPVADQEKESEADTLTEAEKEMLTDPSDPENGSGADEESGPALDVKEDSDITIVEEETEPQVAEQGENAQEAEEDEAGMEEDEIVAMGLDEEIMLTSLEDPEAKVIDGINGEETEYATFKEAVEHAQNGDTVQLLKNVTDVSMVQVDKNIILNLNNHNIEFTKKAEISDSASSARLLVSNGGNLTINGVGSVTGGHYQIYSYNPTPSTSARLNVYKTVQVEAGGTLTVDNQAMVQCIINYGNTEIKNDAQVQEIGQFGDSFTLNNKVDTSLGVMLGTDVNDVNKTKYLEIGNNFDIDQDGKINILFYDIKQSSVRAGLGTGKKVASGQSGGWIASPTEKPITLTLFLLADSVLNDDILNKLVDGRIGIDISIGVAGDRVKTAVIRVDGSAIVLKKGYQDELEKEESVEKENCIYVSNEGKDDNSGDNINRSVKTIKHAVELAQEKEAKKIYLLDTLEISDTQKWELPEGVTIEPYGEFAKNGHSGPFAEVEEGGSLTLQKIEIKGAGTDVTSNAPLIKVNNGGKLFITNGATLSDNNHGYNNYGSVGGAVYSDGGEIIMDGGVIRNCKAYNGGAVYCNGGSFIMSGGTLGGTLDEKSAGNSAKEAGGAVMLANGARMTLSGSALISENTATDSVIIGYDELGPIYGGNGGGIAVGGCRADSVTSTPYLEMRGGRISHNKMYTCGGGIFVQANAEAKIFAGMIDHNTDMASSGNYSGGGIYVNGARGEIDKPAKKPGYLYLENVLITGNVARHDVGGGIAACPTASAKIFLLDGAAIYGNKYGDAQTARVPSDILIRRDSFQSPGTEIDISEYMSNGQPYLWKEYNGSDDSGVGGLHRSDDDMSLCNLYTDQEYQDDISKDFSVLIISNDGYQAGGGIGTNGTVEIGTKPDVVSISAKKVWVDTGRETNRPKGKIKVWLLRKTESGKFERVAAEYLKPDADGNWGSETVVTFPEQPKYVPGTKTLYEYRVEEAKGIGPYTSTVTKGEEDNSWVITNTYTPAQTTAMIEGTKVLTGREWTDVDSFTFELTETTTAEAGKTIPDALNEPLKATATKAAQDFDFGEFKYTEPYVHTYEVKETGKPGKGITMDGNTYTVTVTVTDKGDGTMNSAVSYPQTEQNAEGKETPATKLTFTNIYKAAAGSIQLGATKVFDRTLMGGEFAFVLQEVDSDGKTVAEGVSQEKTNGSDGKILFDEITYNEAGTYYYQISEVAGSDPTMLSYDTAVKTVKVIVEEVDAKLVATADQTADEVVFTNTSVKAKIDKQDADTGASIPGAVLRIVDKKNADAVVEQWTSNGKPHEIIGKLSKNGSYVLEEVTAPDGYLPTGPIDFTVNEKGETIIDGIVTDVVVMKDTKNTISLLKVDESGQPLAGAHLVIENAEGTAMDSWVSDGEPHETRGLARGHYVMSEVEAPAGYHVAEDVPFEITGDETEPVEVRMADKKIPVADNNKLTVMKHLKLDGITCDIGIHEAEFYVALFSDEERTHRVSDVKKIEFHDNALSTVTFENLGRGTYYVGETDENGVLMLSKKVNDQVIYYAEYGENSSVQFEGSTGEGTAELTNVYVEFPEERYYLSGRLTITKNVLVEGQEAASDDTFYAGIFSDAALTSRVGDVVAIEMNGGSSASVTVYNLAIGESIDSSETYYVAETDANGTPLNPDEIIEYRISVDKSEVIMDADHADQEVVITNDFVEEIETEEEEEEEENISDSSGSGPESGSTAPKTGDETDSVLYLLYMALSVGLFAAAAGEKRRRQRRVKK